MKPFRAEQRLAPRERFRPELILGFVDYGKPVTLYLATRVGLVRSFSSDEGSEFCARYSFLGHHFQDEGSETFACLKVGFTDLEEWAEHHPPVALSVQCVCWRAGHDLTILFILLCTGPVLILHH